MSIINVDFTQDIVIATYNIPPIKQFPALTIELLESSNKHRKFNVTVENSFSPAVATSQLMLHPFYIAVVSPWMDNGVIPTMDDEQGDVVDKPTNVLSMAEYKERHVRQ